ncbi:hypothetical protein Lepto7375DRAFT_1239 [Leptolyngbya sp. PCC 7375]|nr:hypothetical protein Lepto7375DRAFT_1239 [Leptolyngbya sp. PCC 7375]
MPKYTVEEVLEIIHGLSPEEKTSLKTQLSTLLDVASAASTVQQSRSMTVGGDFQIGGTDVTVEMSQQQTVGSHSPGNTAEEANTTQTLIQALNVLHQQVLDSSELNPIEKATAEVPLKTAAEELQKEQPDKSLIDQSIAALKKGLEGVETLAEPVMKVAALVSKAWIVL